MNRRRSKAFSNMATGLAIQWLSSLVSPEEAAKINPESIKSFEAKQDQYVYANGVRRLSVYSTRWFYRKLKKFHKRKQMPDFRLNNVGELG